MRFLSYLLLFSSFLFAASPQITSTMSIQEINKLTASDGAASDWFGSNVAISGDTVVVGAWLDDDLGSSSGSAYIYERNNASGLFVEVAKLTASDGSADDRFGANVAISGDTVVVGAHNDDDTYTDSGSAYLYEKPNTGWINATQNAKLTASDASATDEFSGSLAISGDTVVVGAYQDDGIYTNSGSVYLFKKPNTGWANATQNAKLTASDASYQDYFGISVAISGDTVVVGAYGDYNLGSFSGSVYLYEKPNNGRANATQNAKLTASDASASDNFGIGVSISGDTVVVGAYVDDDTYTDSGSAYLYEKPNTGRANATQNAKLTASDPAATDLFGRSVAISGDTVVVGAYRDDDTDTNSGSAYLFEKPSTGWENANQSAKFIASDGAMGDYFGFSVAISGDMVAVGAFFADNDTLGDDSGSAYVFKVKKSEVNPAIIMYLLN